MTEPVASVGSASARAAAGSGELRPGGMRLGAVLLAVALLVGTLAAAAALVTTRFPPEALGYVPAGSAVVVEIRPDLPGDQRDRLGTLLARFPAFAGEATAAGRIDRMLERLVDEATDGRHAWEGDLKAYSAGPFYLVVPALVETTEQAVDGTERMLVVLTPEGAPGCQGLEDGSAVTVERHRDVDLRIRSGRGHAPACAVAGKVILLGDPASIRAAIDARVSGRGVAGDDAWQAAATALEGEHAARMYLNGPSVARMAAAAAATAAAQASPRPSMNVPGPAGMAASAPAWLASGLRFTAEGAIVDSIMPDPRPALLAAASPSARGTIGPDAVSRIAPLLPATTIAVVEVHQAGLLLGSASSAGGPAPSTAPELGQLNAVLGLLGGGTLFGSLDQAAVVLARHGDTLGGGLVIEAADAGAARSRLDALRTLFAVAAPGTTDTEYRGARLITIPVGSLLDLAGALSRPGRGSPPAGGGRTLPFDLGNAVPSGLSLVLAVHQSFVVAGLGDSFVKAVIDTTAGSSLADQSTYRMAIQLAGTPNPAQAYLDIPNLVAVLRSLAAGSRGAASGDHIFADLEPIAAVAMGSTTGGGLVRTRVVYLVP